MWCLSNLLVKIKYTNVGGKSNTNETLLSGTLVYLEAMNEKTHSNIRTNEMNNSILCKNNNMFEYMSHIFQSLCSHWYIARGQWVFYISLPPSLSITHSMIIKTTVGWLHFDRNENGNVYKDENK